jgi:ATP-dependent Clp protease ATP-binding subunit ClpA
VTVIDHCGAQAKVNFWETDDSVKESHQRILSQIDDSGEIPHALFEDLNNKLEKWQEKVLKEEPAVELQHLKDYFETKKNPLSSSYICAKVSAFLKKEFVGQKQPINDFFNSLIKVSMGLGKRTSSAPDSYLFHGGKSSGKTLFTKTLKDGLEKNGASVIYYSGTQLSDSYAPYKIISEHGKNTTLCEKVVMNPNCVIIIDDFEDIHFSCVDLFLQILKEGRLQMSNGDVADFSNCKFVFTCKSDESSSMGFNSQKENLGPKVNKKLSELVEKTLFLSNPSPRDLRRITYNRLNKIKSGLAFQDIGFSFDFKFIKKLVEKAACEGNCVAAVNEAIEKDVVANVSTRVLNGEKDICLLA